MAYRDERDALRARVETLQEQLAAAGDSTENFERALRGGRRRGATVAVAAAVAVTLGAAGAVAWGLSKRAATRAIHASWSELSGCLIGEPLAEGEEVAARARHIQLASAFTGAADSPEGPWPGRCHAAAHQLYLKLRDDGRAPEGEKKAAYWAEALATKLKQKVADEELPPLLDQLWRQVREAEIAPAAPTASTAPRPASPLHLEDLGASAITSVDTAITNVFVEALTGPERHVVIDAPNMQRAILCTVAAKSAPLTCRLVPSNLQKRGLRLLGTTDAGAAPLVFAGQDGVDGVFRSDTGERIATAVRAYSGYSAANGYVALQTWPSDKDGSFHVIEQQRPGAAVTTTAVEPRAQTQPVTAIHRSRVLWDKAVVQLIDEKNLKRSPWFGYRTLGKETMGEAFHRAFDLNWINTTITGCRAMGGSVVRVGPSDAFLVFNEGDTWRGPVPASDLGELRCDRGDAVFLSAWPPVVKRCTPGGCAVETAALGQWPSSPRRGMSAVDFADGNVVAAWATDRHGVRFRVGTPQQIGNGSDVVLFDDWQANGNLARASNLSGLRLFAAGRTAILFLATSAGLRAVRLGSDGSFAPEKVEVANTP